MKTINIIGAGNVAHYLVNVLVGADYRIKCIYNRSIKKAKILSEISSSKATDNLTSLPHSDLTIIAIADDAIATMVKDIIKSKSGDLSIIHTSGVKTLDVFPPHLDNVGCIWPLQSITVEEQYQKDIPLCIDARNEVFLRSLQVLCGRISDKIHYMPSQQKKHAHVAAVIANNFTNHLLTLAEQYCTENEISFDLLKPLIFQSIQKIELHSPKDIQTGPARRMDKKTIHNHLDLIKDKNLKKVYKKITKSIINTYHENS